MCECNFLPLKYEIISDDIVECTEVDAHNCVYVHEHGVRAYPELKCMACLSYLSPM